MKRKLILTTTTLVSMLLLTLLLASSFSPFFVSADPINTCGDHSSQSGVVTLNTLGSPCSELIIRDSTVETIAISAQSNIANLTIRNIVCQRSSADPCIHFNGAVTNIEHIEIDSITYSLTSSNIAGHNHVVLVANPITAAAASPNTNSFSIKGVTFSSTFVASSNSEAICVYINAAISQFNTFSISDIVLENFDVSVSSGYARVFGVYMPATVTGTGTVNSSFFMNNVSQKNISLSSGSNDAQLSGVQILSALSGFSIVQFSAISQKSFSLQSVTNVVFVRTIVSQTITGTDFPDSFFSITNITQADIHATAPSSIGIQCILLESTISNFSDSITISDFTQRNITASGTSSPTVRGLNFATIAGPTQELLISNAALEDDYTDQGTITLTTVSSGTFNNVTIADSTLTTVVIHSQTNVEGLFIKNITCQRSSAGICIRFDGAVTNIQHVEIDGITYTHTSRNIGGNNYLVRVAPSITGAAASSSTNSFSIKNVFFSSTIDATSSSQVVAVDISAAISQFNTFSISDIALVNFDITVSSGNNRVNGVLMTGSGVTGSGTPSSSFSINNVTQNNISLSSTSSYVVMQGVRILSSFSGFSSVSFSTVSQDSCSLHGTGSIVLYAIECAGSVTGIDVQNSSFSISDVTQQHSNMSSGSSNVHFRALIFTRAVSVFNVISFSDILSKNVTGSASALFDAHAIVLKSSIVGTGHSNSSFSITNITHADIHATAATSINIHCIALQNTISSFSDSITISDFTQRNITASGASTITVRGLDLTTIAGPTQLFLIFNAALDSDYSDQGLINLTTLSSGTFNNVTIADSTLSTVVINAQTNMESLSIKNITCQRSSAGSCINFNGAVTNVEHVEIDGITSKLTSSNIAGDHRLVHVANPITGAAALSIKDLTFSSTINTTSNSAVFGVHIDAAISQFNSFSLSDILLEDFTITVSSGYARVYGVYISSSATVTGTGTPTSSFSINNVALNSLSLSSTFSTVELHGVRIPSPLSRFAFVTIKNSSISNITVNAATSATVLALSFGTSNADNTVSIQSIAMKAIQSSTDSLTLAVFSPLPYFSSSTVAVSDSTLADLPPSCTSSNCSFLLLEENSLVKGNWNFTTISSSSPSLISATSSSAVFDPSAHFTFDDNYIDDTSNIITQSPSLNLNSSSWTILCSNRWSRSVESRLQSLSHTDSSNPSIILEKCTHTHSHTVSETKYFPQAPTTTFASTLVPLKQYSPIPADLAEFPSFTPPANTQAGIVKLDSISGTTTIEEIIKVLEEFISTGTSPATVTIRSADPTLGTLVSVPENIPASVTPVLGPLGNNITFTATNLTELAIAVKNGFAFSVSPEAEAKNLTEGTYIEIIAKDAGDQQGQTSMLLKELPINQGPIPQYPDSAQATFNVTRGNRFVLNLNSTFVHHQNLQMYFAAHLTDLFPLPRTLALQCLPKGNCTIRGVIETADPLHIEIQSSDDFILRASYVTLVPIVVPIHINENIEMKPILFRPGQQFTYSIPTSFFLSSTAIEYTAVRLATGFLLPPTMVFDAPNILRGQYNEQGLLHLQVRASDLFSDAVRNFTLNFTNVQPFCRNDFTNLFSTEVTAANSSVPNIVPVAALQEFERTIEFSQVCADNDNDPLQFKVDPFGLPTWLRYGIQPGGATTLPQVLRISGTPSQRAENSLLLINITVTDLFSTLILSVPLRIAENQPPRLLRPLPNYTIHPGDVESFTIDLRQHFEDPNDDPFIITTEILTDYAKTWLQVTTDNKNFLYLSMKPPDEIAGQSDDAQDSDDQLLVRIEDPFGNFTESKINIYTRLTTWQKLRTAVYIIAGLFSAFLSIVSTVLLYPYVVNFFRAGSTQIPCPLNARNRKWMIPESATVVEIRDRTTDNDCMWLRNKAKHISVWLYDEITTEEFPHADPPIWCDKIDKGLKLNNIEREPGTLDVVKQNPVYHYCFVRVYNRRGIILVQFEMKYEEVTRGWDFERVAKEEAEEQRQLEIKAGIRIDDGLDSEISINFDADDFGLSGSRTNPINTNFGNNNNNNPDDSRWKHLDTKMMSIDMQLSEGLKESEMKTIKLEQELKNKSNQLEDENMLLKNENKEIKQKLSTLKSMMQSLLQNHSPPTASNTNVNDLDDDNDYDEYDYKNDEHNNDDVEDDEVDLTDILGSPSLSLPPVEVQPSSEFDENLEGMDLGDGKAYRAKGEYDRDLEELLNADATKKEDERKKTVTTFNPIKRELEESSSGFSKSKKFAESTKM